MNNLDYLNEIAKDNRPLPPSKTTATTRLILKILIGGIIVFGALLILGSVLGNKSDSANQGISQLYLRTTNLETAVNTYNKSLKSSQLRAITISLSSTLSSASSQLSSYFSAHEIDPATQESVVAVESQVALNLDTTLNNAKLNGILDRIYASELTLQVSLLLSLITENLHSATDSALIAILNQYLANLSLTSDSLEAYTNGD